MWELKRRAFSQIMAIIVVSVLILIALIVTVIGFKIQETNAIVEEVNNQIIYTESLSKYVDGIIDRVVKYDTFKEVDKVNWGLGFYSNNDDERYVYYEPLYSYYRNGDYNNSNLKYDVRWLWLTYYMRDVHTIFPELKKYVENMNVPPYIKNQTFVYDDKFNFFPIGNRPEDYYKRRLEIIPDFYVYKNLMFTPTLYGFKITTSNYTVVVNSTVTVSTGENKNSASEIDFTGKTGKTPLFISRDVHAGEFYVDFRIIQMYNALLFEHLLFSRNLNLATSKFVYTYVIPNDNEDDGNTLFDQLINKIPYPTGRFYPLTVTPLAHFETCTGNEVISNFVGKYGIPSCSLRTEPVYNFNWIVYNILFTPPYYMDTEHHSYKHNNEYDLLLGLPISMYSPVTKYPGNLYVGNTQFAMLPKSTVDNLLQSTNKNQLSAEVLYVILDAIAHNKEAVFSGKGKREIQVYAYPEAGYGIQFNIVDGDTSRTYDIPVLDTETIRHNEELIRNTVNHQIYFGLDWVSSYVNFPQFIVDIKTGKFIPLTMLYNAYILSHNEEFRDFIQTPRPSGILKKGAPLMYGAYYDYLAVPYSTMLNTRIEDVGHNTILEYLVAKKPNIVFVDLDKYKNEINFLEENLMKPSIYTDSNVFWSYVLYSFGILHSTDSGEIKTLKRNNLPVLLHSGLVGMYQPIALVNRDNYPDFADAIQVWWFPAVKERGATSDYNTLTEKIHYDNYNYKTSEQFSGSTNVKITDDRSVKLIDIVGNPNYFKPDGKENEEKLKIMMSNISISRPVITNIAYRVDSVKIHYYYKPVEIYAHPYTISMHQTLRHPYQCSNHNSVCCIHWKPVWDNTTNQTVEVCTQYAPIYYTTRYGSGYKESRSAPYQFSIFPDTLDSYKLKIFKNFDTWYESILGVGFSNDIPDWKKIQATYYSDNKYYTKTFFVRSGTSHTDTCGCDDSHGEWQFDVDYKKVMLNKYEKYYIVEVAEVDLTLMLTYDLYATDLRFIDEYLNSYRSGVYRDTWIKQYSSYGVLYYTSKGFDDHISLVSDGIPPLILKNDPNYYLSYSLLFPKQYSMVRNDNRDYLDPNFLIAKHLYVKARFKTFVHVKLFIVTRYWYGSPGRLNSAYMQSYLNGGGYYSETSFSHEKFDVTPYITSINQYKMQAISLLPKYYYNADYLQDYGIPILIAPSPADGEPMIHYPLGVPPGVSVDWVAVTRDFEPVIDLS